MKTTILTSVRECFAFLWRPYLQYQKKQKAQHELTQKHLRIRYYRKQRLAQTSSAKQHWWKLCLLLFFYLPVFGQQTIQPLKIGDQVPDLLFENIINYKSSTARLSDFKGKLVILDFWATWCAPCIYTIPKVDSLQRVFGDQIQFIGIAYQDQKAVAKFFEQIKEREHKAMEVPCITSDRLWSAYFPHQTMPHYVWIKGGKVVAITDFQEVNANHIQQYLDNHLVKLPEKKEVKIPFNREAPLLLDRNGGDGQQMIYHSMLTSYIPGLGVGRHYYRYPKPEAHMQRITARNNDLYLLYQLAYGEGQKDFKQKDILLEVAHPEELSSNLTGTAFANWLADGHGYSYELQVPPAMSKQAFKIMQNDLDRFFPQYQVKVEERVMSCWVLKLKGDATEVLADTTSKRKLEVNAFGADLVNVPLFALVERLDGYYLQLEADVLDETGIKEPVSMHFKANMANVASINEGLASYHLQLERAERKIKVLVVKDKKGEQQK